MVFGEQIGRYQMIQHLIADSVAEIEAARLLTYNSAFPKDEGQPSTRLSSISKYFAGEVAVRVTQRVVETFGGYSLTSELPIERNNEMLSSRHRGERQRVLCDQHTR